MIAEYVLNRKGLAPIQVDRTFDVFWLKYFAARSSSRNQTTYMKWAGIGSVMKKCLTNYWALLASFTLIAIVTLTLVSGSSLQNPTFDQAVRFIASDPTDRHPYITGEYVCSNFADDFQTNAKKVGFNCGIVTVLSSNLSSHALNCFNTTDKGMIFVEPQTDNLIKLDSNELYYSPSEGPQENLTVIIGFYIDW
jgi:hypothetical protein